MMADEVIHSLGKMKLTTEEEEVIEVSDERRQEEIESCSQSLLGKFLTCKPFNKNVATITKGMTARNVKFDSILMWVQIWDAPFDMISTTVAAEVGSRLGVVVEVEKRM
ncbi:hypothetical protein SO802_034676 [Lithocarpus litseifolius]|uniref:DUF4283 domain-containing protein n=1 Tax=Lithocarpus litseifolius TaxID=425828 RepID=A0AAW2BIP6_9ROSI